SQALNWAGSAKNLGLTGDFFAGARGLLATLQGASGIGRLVGPLNLEGAGGATRDLVRNDFGRGELRPHPALAAGIKHFGQPAHADPGVETAIRIEGDGDFRGLVDLESFWHDCSPLVRLTSDF